MNYSFNKEIAIKYGVDEAIVLNNITFWIEKNKANNKHFYDGKYWTYNSINAWCELFPFWTPKQIRRILLSLENKGLIERGNFNKASYDRTLWYSLTENSICPKGKMDLPKRENASDQKDKPIPDINTDINTDNKYTSDFESFFTNYHNITKQPKTDKEASFREWKKLTKQEQIKANEKVNEYYNSLSDKKYVKKARTYLKDKNFNDEFKKIVVDPLANYR
jgi:hypothetical protein